MYLPVIILIVVVIFYDNMQGEGTIRKGVQGGWVGTECIETVYGTEWGRVHKVIGGVMR